MSVIVCNKNAKGPSDTDNCSDVTSTIIKIDKTPPTCSRVYVTNSSGTELKYNTLQHVPVIPKANCTDNNACTQTTFAGASVSDSVTLGANKKSIASQKKNVTVTIRDIAGNTTNCSVEVYTIPVCKGYSRVGRGALVPNTDNRLYCTRLFKNDGFVDLGTSITSFCLEWNGSTFKSTHGTPKYLAFCEGGEGASCKAICLGDHCKEVVHSLDEAMTLSFKEGPNAKTGWKEEKNGKTYYFGRFDRYNGKDYPFAARMVSEKNGEYNSCDIDYDADGKEYCERYANNAIRSVDINKNC